MKKLSFTAFAAAGLMLASSPVFAATAHKHAVHHHSKAHKKVQKNNDGSVSKTDALNAMSLQKARTPVLTHPAVVTVPQKKADEIQKKTGDAMMPVAPAHSVATTPSSSVMPAPMPAPAAH